MAFMKIKREIKVSTKGENGLTNKMKEHIQTLCL